MLSAQELGLDRPGVTRESATALLAALKMGGVEIFPVSERRATGYRLFAMSEPFDGGTTDIRGVALAVAVLHEDGLPDELDEAVTLAIRRIAASGTHAKGAAWVLDKLTRRKRGGRK